MDLALIDRLLGDDDGDLEGQEASSGAVWRSWGMP
jgi:hypothetical protein